MIRALFLSLALLVGGCALFQAPPASVNPAAATTPQAAAQASINAGLSAILALAQTTRADAASGVVTVYEANVDLAKLADAKAKLDYAQKILDLGDVNGAEGQAEIATQLITLVRIEIQKRVRKENM